jgi:hypothetical protein
MTSINRSDRARNTPPSPIRKPALLANKAQKSAIHVFHLNIGQPDLERIKSDIELAVETLAAGLRQYKTQ